MPLLLPVACCLALTPHSAACLEPVRRMVWWPSCELLWLRGRMSGCSQVQACWWHLSQAQVRGQLSPMRADTALPFPFCQLDTAWLGRGERARSVFVTWECSEARYVEQLRDCSVRAAHVSLTRCGGLHPHLQRRDSVRGRPIAVLFGGAWRGDANGRLSVRPKDQASRSSRHLSLQSACQ